MLAYLRDAINRVGMLICKNGKMSPCNCCKVSPYKTRFGAQKRKKKLDFFFVFITVLLYCGYKSRAVIISKFIFKIPFSAVINRVRLILMSG